MIDPAEHIGLMKLCAIRIGRDFRIDSDELTAEAALALLDACRSFDESRGFKFSTYAYAAITRRLRRYIRYGIGDAIDRNGAKDGIRNFRFDGACRVPDSIDHDQQDGGPPDVRRERARQLLSIAIAICAKSLTEQQIDAMIGRARGEKQIDIAKRWGVGKACVSLWQISAINTIREMTTIESIEAVEAVA